MIAGLGNTLQHVEISNSCISFSVSLVVTILTVALDLILLPDGIFSQYLPHKLNLVAYLTFADERMFKVKVIKSPQHDIAMLWIFVALAIMVVPQLIIYLVRLIMTAVELEADERDRKVNDEAGRELLNQAPGKNVEF